MIALSTVLYAWTWTAPRGFAALVAPRDPCATLAAVSSALKVLQFAALAAFVDWRAVVALLSSPARLLPVAALVAIGQTLNAAVYARLGSVGVYYGWRFGRSVPWCTGFPFLRMLPHPQYLGSSLTLAGLAMAGAVPLSVVLWWTANYVFLAAMESVPPAAGSALGDAGGGGGSDDMKRAPPPAAAARARRGSVSK